jgi:hypothetical protein
MKGTYYLPVTVSFHGEDFEKNLHWSKKSNYFYYPYVFVSPFVTGMKTTRERDFPDAKYITADSGGYQIGVHQKDSKGVSALDVLRWQEKIADVAFTVDIPTFSYEQEIKQNDFVRPNVYRHYSDEYFEKAMKKSVINANNMYEAQENEKMQLWAVCQGGNYDDLMTWYKAITKEHRFDGYTFPMASTFSPRAKEDWLDQIRFAKEVGTNWHFLGRCEPLLVAIFAKLSQKTGKVYTYDTSSAAGGLTLGKYHDPHTMRSLSYAKNVEHVNFDLDGPNPCDCPVCSKHTVGEMINGYYLLYMHNVYVRQAYNNYINVLVQDDALFDNLINKLLETIGAYKKHKKRYKQLIDNLVYDEPVKVERIQSFF